MITTTAEKIIVMQGNIDGEIIQTTDRHVYSEWIVTPGDPEWNWEKYKYRIKPKPKVLWVNMHNDGGLYAYSSQSEAINASCGQDTVKFVEDFGNDT